MSKKSSSANKQQMSQEKLELIAYLVVGVLALVGLLFLSVLELRTTSDRSIPEIVYAGLIGTIWRVAIKGFSLAGLFGQKEDKKNDDKK